MFVTLEDWSQCVFISNFRDSSTAIVDLTNINVNIDYVLDSCQNAYEEVGSTREI